VTQGLTFFLSSTKEFNRERKVAKKVIRRLLHTVFDYLEDFLPGSPASGLIGEISDCDALIGILGASYGTQLPAGQNQSINRLEKRRSPFYHPARPCSIVEWEFHMAFCKKIRILPLLKSLASEEYSDIRQREFVGRVQAFRTGLTCDFFSDLSEFEQVVEKCVLAFNRNQLSRLRSRESFYRFVITIAVAACLIAAVGIGGTLLGYWAFTRILEAAFFVFITIVLLVGVILARSNVIG
jgi:Domain of unknown function (DUF4062)